MKKSILKDKKIIIIVVLFVVIILLLITMLFKNKVIKRSLTTNIKLKESNELKLVDYEDTNFKMKIPEGWKVDVAGENMYFSINVYNPKDDRYQIFAILKAEPLLKNNKAKTWYENYYKSFGGEGNKLLAKAIVLESGTVESFYNNFNNYVTFAKEMGSTYKAPNLGDFKTIETYDNNSKLKDISIDDKILRGTFENSEKNKKGEGLFMATIVNAGSNTTLGYDVLYYTAYNVIGITTAENDLINYEEILTKSLNSLEYKESFVNATIKNSEIATKNALDFNASIQSAYDSYNNAWNNRQKTYDITSQKYSDATLGYERVYNTETGEIYKAYNGFTDDYDGSKYKIIEDDMYTKQISGYIEK